MQRVCRGRGPGASGVGHRDRKPENIALDRAEFATVLWLPHVRCGRASLQRVPSGQAAELLLARDRCAVRGGALSFQAGNLHAVHRRLEADHDAVMATRALLVEVVVHVNFAGMIPADRHRFEERQKQAREALNEAERSLAFAMLIISRLREVVP